MPLMLASQLKTAYFWWLNWDFDYSRQRWVILEIVPPKEILIPLKAMEDVFAVIVYSHEFPCNFECSLMAKIRY